MRKKIAPSPDFSDVWRTAGDRIADSGNRLVLIGALITLLPVYLLYVVTFMISDILVYLVYQNSPVSSPLPITLPRDLFLLALTLLLVLPLTVGFFRMCHRTARGLHVTLADLFSCFDSGASYRKSLLLSFDLFWRVGLLTGIAIATCSTMVSWLGNDLGTGLLCGLVVLVEVLVGLPLVLRRFSTWAISIDRDLPCVAAGHVAKRIARRTRHGGMLFLLNMVPRLLLGVLTLGIFLIWEVLPRMCVAYFLYCNKLCNMIDYQSEEYKHE